jgi:hypothetical protein
MKTVF